MSNGVFHLQHFYLLHARSFIDLAVIFGYFLLWFTEDVKLKTADNVTVSGGDPASKRCTMSVTTTGTVAMAC